MHPTVFLLVSLFFFVGFIFCSSITFVHILGGMLLFLLAWRALLLLLLLSNPMLQ